MRFLMLIPFLSAMTMLEQCLAVEEVGIGDGVITVENNDNATVDVLISDNDKCVIGLNSAVGSNTTRTFNIAVGAYLCIGKAAFPIEDGKKYAIESGALVPVQ